MQSYPPPLPAVLDTRPPVHPARGWLLIALGAVLSVSMALIANVIHQTIRHNGDPGVRSHWTGGPEITRAAFELFGAVFLFGAVSVAAGVYILRTRRVSRVLTGTMLVLVLAIFAFGYLVTTARPPG